jgi:CRAL/TRIO domain
VPHAALVTSTFYKGIRNFQDYYGSMAKKIIVTNAPYVFRVVWSIAQHFCNDSLKKTIVFCNAKNTEATLKLYMDLKVLPPAFYKEGKGRPGIGFAQTSLKGGIVPADLKEMGCSETVTSCDSTVLESHQNSMARQGISWSKSETIPEQEDVSVQTTPLLTGFWTETNQLVMVKF